MALEAGWRHELLHEWRKSIISYGQSYWGVLLWDAVQTSAVWTFWLSQHSRKLRAKRQKSYNTRTENVDDTVDKRASSGCRDQSGKKETRILFLNINQQVVCGVTIPACVRCSRASCNVVMVSGISTLPYATTWQDMWSYRLCRIYMGHVLSKSCIKAELFSYVFNSFHSVPLCWC